MRRVPLRDSGVFGVRKLEDSCLVKFNKFLGVSTVGYENEILGLMQKMVLQQPKDEEWELDRD